MPRILTFAAKWEPDSPYFRGTKAICLANIEVKEREYISLTAQAVFRLLSCRGYTRVDMRMDKTGRLNVIEVNPNPDISPCSGAVGQAEAAGMNYTQFIDRIVQLALEKTYYENQDPPYVEGRQTCPDKNTAKYARIQAV